MSGGLALSALEWWSEAGVDLFVDETPRNWLTPPAQPAANRVNTDNVVPIAAVAPRAAPPAAPVEPAPTLPHDLADYRRWLLTDPSVPGPKAARLDGFGDPASGIVIVLDMPEPEDRAAGILLSGETGARFDRMLAMIELDRQSIYAFPFAPARPATGKVSPADQTLLVRLLEHHLSLARPKKLLLLGDALSRAVFSLPIGRARPDPRTMRVAGTDVPAILSFPPRMLAQGANANRQQARDDLVAFAAL